MPDPITRSKRYRERAVECRRLASLADNDHLRAEYEQLAGHYDEIAEAELKIAEEQKKTR
jgi:hypothetical protein